MFTDLVSPTPVNFLGLRKPRCQHQKYFWNVVNVKRIEPINYHVDYYLTYVPVNVFKVSFCINCSLLTCTDVQCDRSYICN